LATSKGHVRVAEQIDTHVREGNRTRGTGNH